MDSEQKIAARDKVVTKACSFIDCRNKKNAATGRAKEDARSVQRTAENELALAVEKYQKEN